MSSYKTFRETSHSEFTIKRSKFISSCINVSSQEQASQYIEKIKSKYHDAKHNTYAYYIHDPEILKYSDDGEPQGTAGIQILSAIKNFALQDVLIVVTRYFGGVLLGAGGLSRAYRTSAEEGIKNNSIVTKELCVVTSLDIPYTLMKQVSNILNSNVSTIEKIDYGALIKIIFYIKKESFNLINRQLSKCMGKEINLNILEERYHVLDKYDIINKNTS